MENIQAIILEAERICGTTAINSPHQIIGSLATLLEMEREKVAELERRMRWSEVGVGA